MNYKTQVECSYCRLCATLFPETWLQDIPDSLNSQINQCFQIHISSDNYPKQICPPCSKSVLNFHEFYEQVTKAQTVFEKGQSVNGVPKSPKVEFVEYTDDGEYKPSDAESDDSGDEDYAGFEDNESNSDKEDDEWDVKLSDLKLNGLKEIKTEGGIIPKGQLAEIYEDTPEEIAELKSQFEAQLTIFKDKKENSSFMTDERHARIIRELEFNATQPNVLAVEQRRLMKYELHIENGQKRLILPANLSNGQTLFYVPKSELFECIRIAHVESGHGGRARTEDLIKPKYKNITRELIMMYLNLCKTCKRRRGQMKQNARLRQVEQIIKKKESGKMAEDNSLRSYKWKCNECSEIVPTATHLRDHYAEVHSKPVEFKCTECTKVFSSYVSFRCHMLRHRNKFRFRCEICQVFYSSKQKLQLHKETHSQDRKKYFCSQCGKSFLTERYLEQHTRKVHLGMGVVKEEGEKYECDECGKKFASMFGLKNHKQVHVGVREHICEHCGKSFIYKRYLDSHMIAHSDERPFKCDKCDESFKTKKYLQNHRYLHSGIKPFQCDICGKKFPRKAGLRGHSLKHSDVLAFKCDICGKGFKSKKNVTEHRRLHTGERPYSCEPCNRHFACSSNYDDHMRRHHGIRKFKKTVAVVEENNVDGDFMNQ